MRNISRYLPILLAIGLGTASCSAQKAVSIHQRQFRLPVLIGKEHNPVSLLTIRGDANTKIDGVEFKLSHTGKALAGVSIWWLGNDSAKATEANMKTAKLIGSAPAASGKIRFKEPLNLTGTRNYFIVTAKASPVAALSDSIGVKLVSAMWGKQRINALQDNAFTGQRVSVALRQHQQDSVFMHRIPGIATAKDGALLAIYDARYLKGQDLQGHIDIGLSRSGDQGRTWEPMKVVLDRGTWGNLPERFNGISDANILVDRTNGEIYVAGLWMYGLLDTNGKFIEGLSDTSTAWNHQWRNKGSQPGRGVKQTAQFLITKSTDNGRTWGEPVNLTEKIKPENWWLWAPAPGAGITMSNGTLVFPTQGRDSSGHPFSNITYSTDHGKTWVISNPATPESTTENMAVELQDGSIMLNMRANSNRGDSSEQNGRSVSVTKNLGQTWTIHPSSHKALIEPTCMASIIRHDYQVNGEKRSMLVFCNPASKLLRNNISVKVSFDDGNTWQERALMDEFKGRGYSCVTSIHAGSVGVLYESSQADLVFASFSLNELLK